MTLFAVFSTKVEYELISFTIGALKATVGSVAHILDLVPTIDKASGRTLIPVRFLAEALGAKVEWIVSTQKVIITEGGRRIVLTIGSPEVLIDGEKVTIDIVPEISPEGRTVVPLRFICQALDALVEYDQQTQQVHVSRKILE